MTINSLNSGLRNAAPPRIDAPPVVAIEQPLDALVAKEHKDDDKLASSLKAMAALAMTLVPQVVHAGAAPPVEVQQVQETEQSSVKDRLDSLASSARSIREQVRQSIDPNGLLKDRETEVGDYKLRFRPMDVNINPRFQGFTPGLKLKGEFLETNLAKTESLGGGWTTSQGASARLRGQVTTYGRNELDLEAGLYKEYRGPIAQDFQVRLRADAGIRHRFVGENPGMRVGVGLHQELEGGHFETFGHEYQLYAEGRQGLYYNVETSKPELSYSVMAGPKKDFDVSLLGKKGKLTIAAGPEISGNNQGEAFNVGFKTKARLRF